MIRAVVSDATGTAMPLNRLDAPFQVVTLVARGPGGWHPDASARVELVFRGPTTVRFRRALETPAPTIIAHNFVVPALPSGTYFMQVRLVMRDTTSLVESAPVFVSVP